jgi:predicted Zn-dependent peptidase
VRTAGGTRAALALAIVMAGCLATRAAGGTDAGASNTASSITSAVKIPPLALTDTKLDNGLRVIIAPDHTAPVYGLCVTYDVGSRVERPGRTGFAHLFEHMMFEGSENVGKGEHFSLIETNGGDFNGTTNEDRTNYFESLPKNQLDLGLFLEADRMGHLAVNQTNLDNQRKAVQEERRLGVDNQPYGHAELDVDNLAYDNFAYKHSTIGSMDDLNASSLEDVQGFFRTYYAPNNAVLTIVGDVDPAQALERVKHYFGDLKPQTIPPRGDLTEPEHYGERHETIYDPLANLPMYFIAYHVAPGDTPGNFAAQLLGDVLATGHSSLLYQHLIEDQQLATDIETQVDARIGTSQFYIQAVPRPGVKPEDLKRAIDTEIAKMVSNGVTQAELDTAKAQELRDLVRARQSDLRTSINIGHDAVYFNDPELVNQEAGKFAAVTLADVNAAAKTIFRTEQRTVVLTLPESERPKMNGAEPVAAPAATTPKGGQ